MSDSPRATELCFVDSNIWLYALLENGKTPRKAAAARSILLDICIVSTQVVNEICVNLLRKAGRSEEEVRELIRAFHVQHRVMPIEASTLVTASELRESYSFSFWDSLFVAAALDSGAKLLY
jgi:predicted nucleic acid-binding protein